jgi:hypothetical protein
MRYRIREKTVQTQDNGKSCIWVWVWMQHSNQVKSVSVLRKPRRLRLLCNHNWRPVSRGGHGNWRRGCSKCGALGR